MANYSVAICREFSCSTIFNFSHFTSSFLVQRVNQCLRDACHHSGDFSCTRFIDCGHGNLEEFQKDPSWEIWKNNKNASDCFMKDVFSYGIYAQAVNLTTEQNIITRYTYSLFWGFQVFLLFISTVFAVSVYLVCCVYAYKLNVFQK